MGHGTPAPACKAALAEATRLWPKRNKASDGIMGDAAHHARNSDHNLGNAWDLTHDPANGCDAHAEAEKLKAKSPRDPRIKYIISNRRIWNPSISHAWRPYGGSNPHTKHIHVSIHGNTTTRNNTRPWFGGAPVPAPKPTPSPSGDWTVADLGVVRKGSKGDRVRDAQALLNARHVPVAIDGDFGPGTETAVRRFQQVHRLGVDGVVGPNTWRKLLSL